MSVLFVCFINTLRKKAILVGCVLLGPGELQVHDIEVFLFLTCNNFNSHGIFNLHKCITLKSEHHSSLKFSVSFHMIVLY